MRVIDADKLKPDCMTKDGRFAISQNQIANAETIKPKTGHWIESKWGFECSECHKFIEGAYDDKTDGMIPNSNYCPKCGAEIKEEVVYDNK